MSTLTRPRRVRTGLEDSGGNEVATSQRIRDDRARHRRNVDFRHPWLTLVGPSIGLAVVAAVLRLFHITTSYHLFIDEATYSAIARDTTWATGPTLHGLPFVLHPPLALLLLAAPAHMLGTPDITTLAAGMRPVVAIVGALTVGVLYLTLRRAGLRKAAYVAATLVALDPLVISFDSRVMLESFAQLFAVLTIAMAIHAATSNPHTRVRWSMVTALAGAATLGTKETFGLVVFATLVVVALTAPRGHRLPPLVAVAGTLVGYALVNLAMINWSGFRLWWLMRTVGLSRLLGTNQPTGFKAEGAQSSFWERIVPNGAELGATYAILAIGGMCALSLLWGMLSRRTAVGDLSHAALTAARVFTIWAVCACGYVTYAVAFGSLEEQMFYIAAAPCAAAIAIRVFLTGRRILRRAAVAGVVAIMLLQGVAWFLVHTTPDDVYAQALARISDVAPAGSTMAVTEETAQFVLSGYDLGQWVTVPELRANDVEYVLLSERLVRDGYGLADKKFAEAVRAHGSLILSVQGRESDLQLYDVRDWIGTPKSVVTTTEGGS